MTTRLVRLVIVALENLDVLLGDPEQDGEYDVKCSRQHLKTRPLKALIRAEVATWHVEHHQRSRPYLGNKCVMLCLPPLS